MRLFVLAAILTACALPEPGRKITYPRIGNLWGYSPVTRDYDRLSRYGLLVMGGGAPADFRRFRREMQARRSGVVVLGTAPLMNLGAPKDTPWMQDAWYLRRPDGEKIIWWAGQIYTPNLLRDDCLEALVRQSADTYGGMLADGALDGLFFDSVVGAATWLGDTDTDGDGKADNPSEVNARWQSRQNLFFDRLRERWPGVRVLANDVDLGHAAHLNGRLFEGAPLLDRVAEGTLSPQDAIAALNGWMRDARQPGLTFAIMTHPVGWQGWRVGRGNTVTTPGEVERARRDFHRMRLGLLTTLMTDAFYAYDMGTVWYGLPWWYAEYDAPLGRALGPAREVFDVPPVTLLDWKAGDPSRAFRSDLPARFTAQGMEAAIADPQAGWSRVLSTDPRRVRFEPGKTYRIEADCEILRRPTGTFQFNLRTTQGGWEMHDKGMLKHGGDASGVWRIRVTVVPDDFEDYSAEWHLLGAGALRLKRLTIRRVNDSYLQRDFDGGTALLNTTLRPIIVKLPAPMRHLKDAHAPRHVVDIDDGGPAFRAKGAWEPRGGEDHYVGGGYRLARKPGAAAFWTFTVPATDRYTLFASAPGGRHLTGAAEYEIVGVPSAVATRSQRTADGGWMRLFSAPLQAGRRYMLRLCSAGIGATAADAVHLESTARYNNGTMARRVTLPPLDGVLLLKPGRDESRRTGKRNATMHPGGSSL